MLLRLFIDILFTWHFKFQLKLKQREFGIKYIKMKIINLYYIHCVMYIWLSKFQNINGIYMQKISEKPIYYLTLLKYINFKDKWIKSKSF